MNCPYCEQEMPEGYLPAIKEPLYWIPATSKPTLFIFTAPKNGVKLTTFPIFRTTRVESLYCKKCQIIITPVKKIKKEIVDEVD